MQFIVKKNAQITLLGERLTENKLKYAKNYKN